MNNSSGALAICGLQAFCPCVYRIFLLILDKAAALSTLRLVKCLGKPRKTFFRCAMPKGALPLWKPRTRRREARGVGHAVASLPTSPHPEPEAGSFRQASRGFRGISSAQKAAPAVFHDPLTPGSIPKTKWRAVKGKSGSRS